MNHIAAGPVAGDEAALPSLGARRIPLTPDAPQTHSHAYVRLQLIRLVNDVGSYIKAGKRLGVKDYTVWRICQGKMRPGNKVARAMGYRVPETRGGMQPGGFGRRM